MNKVILYDTQDILPLLVKMQQEPKIGFDIEIESFWPEGKIAGFSLYSPAQNYAVYIPLNHPEFTMPADQLQQIAAAVSTLKVITYNGQLDSGRWYYEFGHHPVVVGDAYIMNRMLQGMSAHTFGLKPLALELGCCSSYISLEDILGEGNFDFTKASLNDPKVLEYTTQDAILAVRAEESLRQRDLKPGKYPAFDSVYRLEMDILPILGREELRGLPVDAEAFQLAARRMLMEADDLNQEICQDLGRDPQVFNLDSNESLSAALFNKSDRIPKPLPPMKPRQRKIPVQDQRDLPGLSLTPATTGVPKGPNKEYTYYSTSILELQRIDDQHPVIEKILRWKKLDSVNRDVKNVDKYFHNGRLFPRFLTVGTDATSRVYSGEPNIIGMSRTVRAAMKPPQGKIYIHVDFKAAEWHLAGLMSGEERILDALLAGIDPHTATYSMMSGKSVDQVSKEERSVGKILNYAALFGSTGYSLARSLKCDEGEAAIQQKKFWETYPKLAAWRNYRYDYATKHARTLTVLGRERRLNGIFSGNPSAKKADLRRSVNTATQSSCGDVLKLAIRAFDKETEQRGTFLNQHNARVVIPVYDAVLVEMDHPQGVEQEVWRQEAEASLRRVLEVDLLYEGRFSRMRVDMGFSTESWLAAMGK